MQNDFSKYLDEHFNVLKHFDDDQVPEQEAGPALTEVAEALGMSVDVLRQKYQERGELVVVDGVERVLRWLPVDEALGREMEATHAEFERVLLGYRTAVQQGFMSPLAAWECAREEFDRQKTRLAGIYRRLMGL